MKVWRFLKSRLKTIYFKRFPKVDFFIDKILEALNISKRPSYKISSKSREKYDIIYLKIVYSNY